MGIDLTHLDTHRPQRPPEQPGHFRAPPMGGPSIGLDASPPKAPAGVTDIGQLIATRRNTHGDWAVQSATEQAIKDRLRQGPAWPNMSPAQRAAAEMIAVKLSRIVSGNPNEPDHWDDIAGYARLGKQGHAVADPVKDWPGHT